MAAMTAADLVTIFTTNVTGLAPYNDPTIITVDHLDNPSEQRILAVVEAIHAAMAAMTTDVEARLFVSMVEKMMADVSNSVAAYPTDAIANADAARLAALAYMNRPSTPKIP